MRVSQLIFQAPLQDRRSLRLASLDGTVTMSAQSVKDQAWWITAYSWPLYGTVHLWTSYCQDSADVSLDEGQHMLGPAVQSCVYAN